MPPKDKKPKPHIVTATPTTPGMFRQALVYARDEADAVALVREAVGAAAGDDDEVYGDWAPLAPDATLSAQSIGQGRGAVIAVAAPQATPPTP